MYFWYYLHFFYFDLEKFSSKNCKYIIFLPEMCTFGRNISKDCSRMIVVHVVATVFSKVYTECHNIANGIKPGSYSKKTDKHAANCSKAVCWGVK